MLYSEKFPQTNDSIVGFGDWSRAAVPCIPATVISGPFLKKSFKILALHSALCLHLFLRVALTSHSRVPCRHPTGVPPHVATFFSVGAVATNWYMGLINEPSHSSPESRSPAQPREQSCSPTSVDFHLGLDGKNWKQLWGSRCKPRPSSHTVCLPAWSWAGVESLLQAKVWSRLSPAPCKPYQDIQLLVLMAGKVAVCLLDSYHREGGKNNGLLLFPCSSSKRLKSIFMCCCCPHILWPDPALSCVAVSRTRVVPGPGSASRWENRTLLPESGPNGFLEMPKGEGRLARSPASHRVSAVRETPGTSQLFAFFFCDFFPLQGSSQPRVQARQEKSK